MSDIELGDKVEDRVTGLVGIAVARVEYLNGCVQFCVQPRSPTVDALSGDRYYIDEGQLKRLDAGLNKAARKPLLIRHGGPGPNPRGFGRKQP